ncbi:WD40 repeat-like protein [Artomyces pyxidatus]|uniref:WD40 repeat-like protein n=1 Tax=Artomyces pyxidatus TaxID=48021 RepID=A0ACB8TA18_9AGAM|nr:WD40 repeat-like protein [Artomyces pyxidatus]
MANSDSEEEIDDAEFDNDGEDDIDQEIFDAIEAGVEEATDGDQSLPTPPPHSSPPRQSRSLSPTHTRRAAFRPTVLYPKSYTVEAICALPHPVPTHSLAGTPCMTHFLTGSEDGYVRDYDIFSAVNGKVFLTAPQRHHAGVVEGILKAGQVRSWWENPGVPTGNGDADLSPIHSLAIHGDGLWSLAGSNTGHINLFTIRHEPGRLFHTMQGHRGPVSALSLQHDEQGFFSAGWDGHALRWDLNTGQIVRRFTAHGAQLAALAIRPLASDYPITLQPSSLSYSTTVRPKDPMHSDPPPLNDVSQASATQASTLGTQTSATSTTLVGGTASSSSGQPSLSQLEMGQEPDVDAKSEASLDSLFGDEPDAEGEPDNSPLSPAGQATSRPVSQPTLSVPTSGPGPTLQLPSATPLSSVNATSAPRPVSSPAPVPKNAPPILDPTTYNSFSSDVLMTAAVDGQVVLWDCRVASGAGRGVGRLWMSDKTPPWCLSACWSANGSQIYAGRRNGTIDVWDVRQLGRSGPAETPRLLKTLRNPLSSGVVSCVVAFPDGRHIACASSDNIRLWNAAEAGEGDGRGKMQFKIIPGHHGGIVSQMLIDPAARFLVSASGNRGWHGDATRTVFVHDIKPVV